MDVFVYTDRWAGSKLAKNDLSVITGIRTGTLRAELFAIISGQSIPKPRTFSEFIYVKARANIPPNEYPKIANSSEPISSSISFWILSSTELYPFMPVK